ncbi:hypothetical protein ALI144C_31490 [Actinosynnema sp. ALI-1.44]|nr:hypothetical protein ALI144C_31490 [Actinosynnema sp. ALI-1.44]
MRLAFAMLADAASVADGKLYVHGGGWNQLTVDRLPTVHPSLAVVFVLEMTASDNDEALPLSVELGCESGPLATMQGTLQPALGDGTAPLGPFMLAQAVTLTQVPLPVVGDYQVRVVCAGTELGAVQLSVALATGTAPPDGHTTLD